MRRGISRNSYSTNVLRSVDLWIKGCMQSCVLMLRCRACFPSPSARVSTHRFINKYLQLSTPLNKYYSSRQYGGMTNIHFDIECAFLMWERRDEATGIQELSIRRKNNCSLRLLACWMESNRATDYLGQVGESHSDEKDN